MLHIRPAEPPSGLITIALEGMQKVMVYNTFGHTLLTKEASSDVLQLNLSGFEDGLYWVKVMAQGEMVTRRFILSR
jgi:hypothetical protein